MNGSMRVLFAGSPAIAVPSLEALSRLEIEGRGVTLAGILTNCDKRRGRRCQDEPTDISAAALRLDLIRKEKGLPPIPQVKPEKLNAAVRKEVAALAPDILVSFACGHFFGPLFLALFPCGGINIHPSLLPKYRGASPIPAVILAREKKTGICIQRLAAEMDAGDILAKDVFCLSGRETTLTLSETVSRRSALLVHELFLGFDAKSIKAKPQKGRPVYCSTINKEAGLIDWKKSAVEIDAQIRAYTPWPLSFTGRGNDVLYILEAQPLCDEKGEKAKEEYGTVLGVDKNRGILIRTGDGILAVTRLQWQAKKALDWKAFCNGAREFIGSRLG